MAITDYIFCDAQTLIPSRDIVTPYKKYNNLLQKFLWER